MFKDWKSRNPGTQNVFHVLGPLMVPAEKALPKIHGSATKSWPRPRSSECG